MALRKDGVLVFDLDDALTFGKHKGKTLDTVARSTPGYIAWMRKNVEWADVTARVWKLAVAVGISDSEDAADRFGAAGDWGFSEF